MDYKYWISDLNTDAGRFASNGVELDSYIKIMLESGLVISDIGIQLMKNDASNEWTK